MEKDISGEFTLENTSKVASYTGWKTAVNNYSCVLTITNSNISILPNTYLYTRHHTYHTSSYKILTRAQKIGNTTVLIFQENNMRFKLKKSECLFMHIAVQRQFLRSFFLITFPGTPPD